jgi:hypothetical protein
MSWRAMRLAIIYLYAALFMLLGLLVLFWDGAGLFIFHWLARLILKISLALAAAAYLALIVKLNSWEAAVVPLGFGGLLLAELWFGKLDRQIAAARRDARKS